MRLTFLLALALIGGAAPSPWPEGVRLAPGRPVSEDYRRQFDRCDADGTFRAHALADWHDCASDPNRVTALRRLPSGAIAYASKLAVDLDGSAFACGPRHQRSDQCPTSLMLPGPHGREVPVDADAIPYVVIPEAGPADVRGEFARLTHVGVGDFGVVLARGRVVPVIVADTGPYSKLGEGSIALHRALGHEVCVAREHGVCARVEEDMASLQRDVVTILFPGSARDDLTPSTIAAVTEREGLRLWAKARVRDAPP